MLRSRIVGEGEEAPDQLLANPLNWRTHPKQQVEALEGLLSEVGWVQRVIVNKTTGHVVDGHARVALALKRNEPSVPVLYVDLTEREEQLVLAALDPIGGLATTDRATLEQLLHTVTTTDPALQQLLSELAQDAGIIPQDTTAAEDADILNHYSSKIEPPTYTPTAEEPPPVAALFSRDHYDRLIAEINQAEGIPDDVREFLRFAAHRHIIFNYRNIAEFYCHAPAEVQALMEASALVIIDFKQAIERGYVELSKKMSEIYAATEDWEDIEEGVDDADA